MERKDIRPQLVMAYESCVRTSFASQLPTMVDRNMAIEQAFTVCQTEEKKLQDVSDGAISVYRNTLKEELLRRQFLVRIEHFQVATHVPSHKPLSGSLLGMVRLIEVAGR